jgi:hypothetical protein
LRLIAFALIVALCAAYIPAGAQSGWLVIVSPGTGEALSGRNAEVSVSYNTGSSDRVTRIELAVDGVNYGVKYLSAPTDRGVASFLVDTSRLGNGGHTVLVKIFSGDRLIGSTSSDCRVGNQPVDVLPPDVKFVGIRNGSVVTGVMNVKLSAADGSGEDPLVSVFVDKSLKMIKNSAPYQYTWNSRDYDDGKHVLTALAYDGAGNKGEAEAVEVVVKNSGREPMPVTPAVEKTPLSSRSASAPVKPSIAAVPQDTIKPVVPVERPVQSSSARAAEPRTTPVGSIGGPVAAVERAGRTASRSIDLQPIIMAQATKPTIPTERAVPSASPQSADRQAAATAPTSASITGSEKPMVVAVLPEMTPSSTFDPEMPQVRAVEAPEVKPVSAPTTTQPQAVAPPVKPDIVAALPEDMSAPAVPEVPSAAAPVATPATQHTRVQEPRMRSEEAYSSLGQKLARPEEPVHQPVRIAMAPRL